MGSRRHARECALMILYGMEVSAQTCDAALARFWEDYGSGAPLDPPPPYGHVTSPADRFSIVADPEIKTYTERLVRGIDTSKDEIDRLIAGISHNWRMDRMALVDRNLLRLGVFELAFMEEGLPRGVVINEAVELAKAFGTAESSAFINGILDRVGRDKTV